MQAREEHATFSSSQGRCLNCGPLCLRQGAKRRGNHAAALDLVQLFQHDVVLKTLEVLY